MKKITIVLEVFLLMFFVLVSVAKAEEVSTQKSQRLIELFKDEKVPGSIDCSQFHDIRNVEMSILAKTQDVTPGVMVEISGEITNNNDYPIINGAVYVKVFRGDSFIDQFFAKENLKIASKEVQDISFNWNVPAYAVSGKYQIRAFLVSNKRFDISGMALYNNAPGASADIDVKSEKEGQISFDEGYFILDKEYKYKIGRIALVKLENTISIKLNIKNETVEKQTVPLKWTLYKNNSLDEKNIINVMEEEIELEAGKVKELEYKMTNNEYSNYSLIARANYQDTSSIANLNIINTSKMGSLIDFLTVSGYPLKKNQDSKIFACLGNTGGTADGKNYKLILKLVDNGGKTIHSYEYSGKISSKMGLDDSFKPEKDYNNFTLKAELYSDGKMIDSAEMEYGNKSKKEIEAIDQKEAGKEKDKAGSVWKSTAWIVVVVLLILSVILIAIKKKGSSSFIFPFFLLAGAFFLGAGKAQALTTYVYGPSVNPCIPTSYCSYTVTGVFSTQVLLNGSEIGKSGTAKVGDMISASEGLMYLEASGGGVASVAVINDLSKISINPSISGPVSGGKVTGAGTIKITYSYPAIDPVNWKAGLSGVYYCPQFYASDPTCGDSSGSGTTYFPAQTITYTLTATGSAVNASCGTNAQTYPYDITAYSGTFCLTGTLYPASPSPVFPIAGSSVTWTCAGANGGSNVSCSATRNNAIPCSFRGRIIPHLSGETVYSSETVECGSTCESGVVFCENGNVSGDTGYSYFSCAAEDCPNPPSYSSWKEVRP